MLFCNIILQCNIITRIHFLIYIYNLNLLDAALKPYLEMIDSINESTSKLEAVAYMMDAYSKRLGNFFC